MLLLQRTWVWFSAPMSGGSPSPVTNSRGSKASNLSGRLDLHLYTQTNSHIITNKIYKRRQSEGSEQKDLTRYFPPSHTIQQAHAPQHQPIQHSHGEEPYAAQWHSYVSGVPKPCQIFSWLLKHKDSRWYQLQPKGLWRCAQVLASTLAALRS